MAKKIKKEESWTFYLKISASGADRDRAWENALRELSTGKTETPELAVGPETIYSEIENYGACAVKDGE